MVKLVDTSDLGSGAEKHVGSSPISGNAQSGRVLGLRRMRPAVGPPIIG